VRLAASFSSAVRPLLWGEPRRASVLAVGDAALYLHVHAGPPDRPDAAAVLAVLTHDAVRLPCSVVLAADPAVAGLRGITPDDDVVVEDGRVRWVSGRRPVTVVAAREWAPARARRGRPRAHRLAELERSLIGVDIGVDPAWTTPLRDGVESSVAGLLGRGPGLTPAGDDVLTGYLLAARAFGADPRAVRAEVARLAASRTTALSAQLLRHALAGTCAPEVAAVLDAIGGSGSLAEPLAALFAVGHTSGAALAYGIWLAAAVPAATMCA
jgi:hypothetical protein